MSCAMQSSSACPLFDARGSQVHVAASCTPSGMGICGLFIFGPPGAHISLMSPLPVRRPRHRDCLAGADASALSQKWISANWKHVATVCSVRTVLVLVLVSRPSPLWRVHTKALPACDAYHVPVLGLDTVGTR